MFNEIVVNLDRMIPDWHNASERVGWNILVFMLEGQAQYLINGEEFVLSAGEILFIPIYSIRSGRNYDGQPHLKYTVLFTQVTAFEDEPDFIQSHEYHVIRVSNMEYYKHRIEKIFTELREGHRTKHYICKGILQELLGLLGKEMSESDIAPMKLHFVKTLKSYIIHHYREPIEINELARLIHRSPNYTTSIFKEVMGHSPIQYVHYLRIMDACDFLTVTDMTIASISDYLGYYDSAYFSKTFKKIMSMSPREYVRKQTSSRIQS
ncbi:helix-turn-helix domain-containing protein [Paenibacillus daejeonensis]|uniref:helix-turn-helix domain-containing protein n=1 Tax=Paenibacillus daejeonensis TaxID=135193 RepID=UPI00038131C4|nr:AraC family transcriptional regulator [Paenibacillus daejeonensis]